MSCFSCGSFKVSKALKRINSKVRRQPSTLPLLPKRESQHESHESGNSAETAERQKDKAITHKTFTFEELADATENFSPECLVDVGSFGKVYRGKLEETGQIVAIEELDRNGTRGPREFLVQVLMSSLLDHPNLINLIGYCAEEDEKLLVHEYLPLGSLDQLLHGSSSNQQPLDWYTRMKIALGTAKGLEYLHHIANPPVIYRNLKPSNILLDNEFTAKLSDFGLSKLGPVRDKTHVSTRVMGPYGYIAPEYERTGQLTIKADVYSFGVVLLELVTGRRAIDITRRTEEQNLVSWAHVILKDHKKLPELADPLLQGVFPARGLNQALAVAAMCLQEEETARPMMSDVVTALMYLSSVQNTTSPPFEARLEHDSLVNNEPDHGKDNAEVHQHAATD